MYINTSADFADAIQEKNQIRSYKCTVTYKDATGVTVTETLDASKWEMGSTEITDGCLPGSYFQLGATVSRSIRTVLKNEDLAFAGCKFNGGTLKPYFGLMVNGVIEWVPLGVFVIDSTSKTTAKAISITACDKIIKAEKLLADCSISFPISLSNLLQACANEIGASLVSSNFNNSDLMMNEPSDKTKVTIRELIGGIAAVAGGFACINYSDALEIKSFTLANPLEISPEKTRYSVDVGEANTIDSAVYYGAERNFLKGDTDGKYPVSVEQNAVFENLAEGPTAITQILNTILAGYSGLSIIPIKLEFAGDPRLQAGDPVSLPDTTDGDIVTILTSITTTITASASAECVECSEIDIDFYNAQTPGGTYPSGSSGSSGSGGGSSSGGGTSDAGGPSPGGPVHNYLRRSIYAYPLIDYSYTTGNKTIQANFETEYYLWNGSYSTGKGDIGNWTWMPVIEVETEGLKLNNQYKSSLRENHDSEYSFRFYSNSVNSNYYNVLLKSGKWDSSLNVCKDIYVIVATSSKNGEHYKSFGGCITSKETTTRNSWAFDRLAINCKYVNSNPFTDICKISFKLKCAMVFDTSHTKEQIIKTCSWLSYKYLMD